ncbi:MAG: hypothetical protein KF889_27555 [Alphaproteobacteria bacterium]|nr:hypothetical protein [Alphaproteobacteria bacterium]MCW5743711.1 hypothetical protein [Alphaproteobacteria bacterium]
MATKPSTPSLAISCRRCRHKFEQPLVWLKKNPEFHCPRCDCPIIVESAAIVEAEGALGSADGFMPTARAEPKNNGKRP